MSSNQAILDALYRRLAELEMERPAIDAEFERVARRKQNLDNSVGAVEDVIRQFGGNPSVRPREAVIQPQVDTEAEAFSLKPRTNGHANSTRPGLKVYAKRHFNELPQEYHKDDVIALLKRVVPDLESVNENTLSGVMRELSSSGMARVKTPAKGRSPQIYEKLV